MAAEFESRRIHAGAPRAYKSGGGSMPSRRFHSEGLCPRWDSNPHSEEPDFESGASANSATRAYHAFVRNTFRILTQAV